MSARSRYSPWFRAPRTMRDVMDAIPPPRPALPPEEEYLKHDLPRHCDNPECCVGTIIARCRRCGFVVPWHGRCPATADMDLSGPMVVSMGGSQVIDCRPPSDEP